MGRSERRLDRAGSFSGLQQADLRGAALATHHVLGRGHDTAFDATHEGRIDAELAGEPLHGHVALLPKAGAERGRCSDHRSFLAPWPRLVTPGGAGLIGFVGLVVPHALRRVIGPDHRVPVPASLIVGATMLVLCDVGVSGGLIELGYSFAFRAAVRSRAKRTRTASCVRTKGFVRSVDPSASSRSPKMCSAE